ncbi:bc1736a5-8900-4251-9b79-346c9f0bbf61 [Thermothielavioides terrestris]|jgi:hypothetical protein|nr:bc1736a5-8900-4251-9b79-346c9f0bbf61 [Thermothielavioides terrestris]
MCNWHITRYDECGHEDIERVPYSCEIYTRHKYGSCKYNDRIHRPRAEFTYAPGYCRRPECEMLNYINYQ